MVKSIRIRKTVHGGAATGYWKGITASERLEYTVHVGFSRNDGRENNKATEKALSEALDKGLTVKLGVETSFKAGLIAAKIEAKATANTDMHLNKVTTNNDVERAMDAVTSMANSEQSTDYKTECTPGPEDKGRAGLWQWVIATADKSAEAFTTHTVCRTGSLWNTPPACNHWECDNASCDVCKHDKTEKTLIKKDKMEAAEAEVVPEDNKV